MDTGHEEQGLVALFIFGALTPEDRARAAAHLATCPACASEARNCLSAFAELAQSAPVRTPRPAVRARILAAVRGVAATSRWRGLYVLTGLAGAAAVLVALAATVAWRMEADRAHAAMSVLAAADLARIDLAGQPASAAAFGRAQWSRAHGMVFTATHLPPLPPGMVYQVWVVTATAPPISAGLLTPAADGGAAGIFTTPPDIPPPVAIAVTVEPAGGVPAPTGAKYLVGKT